MAAPIILVLARLIQGFSCGGEVGPATTYLLESAPPHRRAAMTAWQGYSQQFAIFMGSLAGVILAASLSREQLYAWGWRLPFLLGIVIAPVGLYIRRQLPVRFTLTKRTIAAAPCSQIHAKPLAGRDPGHIRDLRWNRLHLRVQLHDHVPDHRLASLGDDRHDAHAHGERCLDCRYGARGLGGSIRSQDDAGRVARGLRLTIYPAYRVITAPDATTVVIVAMNMLLNFVFSTGIGALYAFLPEALPKAVRSSGLAILYALGVTIFGSTTQFVVAWLIDWTKDPMVPPGIRSSLTLRPLPPSR